MVSGNLWPQRIQIQDLPSNIAQLMIRGKKPFTFLDSNQLINLNTIQEPLYMYKLEYATKLEMKFKSIIQFVEHCIKNTFEYLNVKNNDNEANNNKTLYFENNNIVIKLSYRVDEVFNFTLRQLAALYVKQQKVAETILPYIISIDSNTIIQDIYLDELQDLIGHSEVYAFLSLLEMDAERLTRPAVYDTKPVSWDLDSDKLQELYHLATQLEDENDPTIRCEGYWTSAPSLQIWNHSLDLYEANQERGNIGFSHSDLSKLQQMIRRQYAPSNYPNPRTKAWPYQAQVIKLLIELEAIINNATVIENSFGTSEYFIKGTSIDNDDLQAKLYLPKKHHYKNKSYTILLDGEALEWSEGLKHYIELYNVMPSASFFRKLAKLEPLVVGYNRMITGEGEEMLPKLQRRQ